MRVWERTAFLGVLAGAFVGLSTADAIDWRPAESNEAGTRVFESRVSGSSYKAYRVEATLDGAVDSVLAAAVANLTAPSRAPENQRRTLLPSAAGEYLVHTWIEIPVASNRDVVVRVQRARDVSSGVAKLVWHSAAQAGPEPAPGVVRIQKSDGSWTFTPLSPLRTQVIYENHTDVGGRLPAWMAGKMLRSDAVGQIGALRESLREFRLRNAEIDVADAEAGAEASATP